MLILHKMIAGQSGQLDLRLYPLVIFIGILISVGNFFIIKAYSLGAPQGTFTSIYYPLFIIYGIIFGIIFWHEKLNFYQISGLCLTLIGIFLMVYFRK